MKQIKKIVSIMLTLVMVMGLGVTSVVASSHEAAQHQIVITNTKAGHTYQAFQIFKGDIYVEEDGQKTLSNVEWGTGVGEANTLIAALKQEASFAKAFDSVTTAAEVAKAMKDFTDSQMDKFSEIVSQHLSATSAGTSTQAGIDGAYEYTIAVTGDGYYFVKDTGEIAQEDAATRYILQVVGDVRVAAKADAPSLEKEIDQSLICTDTTEGHKHVRACYDEHVKFNNGALGDTVPFSITSSVPKMDGYEKYYFVVRDTLPQGLTFNRDSLAVTIGKTTLTDTTGREAQKEKSYHVNISEDQKTFEVVFENFIQYKGNTDAITISYTAVINDNVVIGPTGEMNTAKLIYSNNPNESDKGTPGEPDYPGPTSPVGNTPDRTTYTYVSGLQLKKIDEDGKSLAGAQFKVTAETLNKIRITETTYQERTEDDEADTENVYYLLKDKTYTKTPPTFNEDDTLDTSKYYENISGGEVTKTYKLVKEDKVVVDSADEGETRTYTAYVDENGILKLEGLSAGTYVFKELKAPNGYNLLQEEVTVTIDWKKPENNSTECIWTVDKNGTTLTADKNNLFTFEVENKKGSLLPSTGGIGTTIFYIIGGILVVGAAILLVTKKRMSSEV